MYRNSDFTKRTKAEPFRHSGDAGRRVSAHRRARVHSLDSGYLEQEDKREHGKSRDVQRLLRGNTCFQRGNYPTLKA